MSDLPARSAFDSVVDQLADYATPKIIDGAFVPPPDGRHPPPPPDGRHPPPPPDGRHPPPPGEYLLFDGRDGPDPWGLPVYGEVTWDESASDGDASESSEYVGDAYTIDADGDAVMVPDTIDRALLGPALTEVAHPEWSSAFATPSGQIIAFLPAVSLSDVYHD